MKIGKPADIVNRILEVAGYTGRRDAKTAAATMLGVSPQTLRNWETGRAQIDYARIAAKIKGVSLDYLVYGEQKKASEDLQRQCDKQQAVINELKDIIIKQSTLPEKHNSTKTKHNPVGKRGQQRGVG